jgi:hypothetical protein
MDELLIGCCSSVMQGRVQAALGSSADFHNVTRSLLPPWNGMFSLAKSTLT